MKIAIYQFNPTVGALSVNTDKLICAINEAKANKAELFITSELAICGYPPEDLLFRPEFIQAALVQLERLKSITDITMLIGCPYRNIDGAVYNSVFAVYNGQIVGRYDKCLLPNYSVFDEVRYFKPGVMPLVIKVKNISIGIIICEDLWHSGPALDCKNADAEILCVFNASPFEQNKFAERKTIAGNRVSETKLPLIYVNQTGGQDELVFDGASFALNSDGSLAMQLPAFSETLAYLSCSIESGIILEDCAQTSKDISDCHPGLDPGSSSIITPYPDATAAIYQALVLAVRDYINKNGFKGALLGLSGGIDSALTLAIAYDALGKDRVMAVMMPSNYTADISVIDSRQMIKNLCVRYEEIEINPLFKRFKQSLSDIFDGCKADTTEENLQARIRGTLLMAISNKFGYLVLTTGNKSEMSTGYATLYGDMAGGFAVLKDVLKTQVYALCNYRNQISNIIPMRIITRPPSAELRDNQTDQDSLPDYAVLDKIIELVVEGGKSSQEIIDSGYAAATVNQVARLLKLNEYKRRQAAVGPKISKVAFARDWRYPITSGYNF